MAVVHQSSATANATGTTFTITKPTGVASGDFLLAWLVSSATTPTAPAGWTLAASDGNGGQLYYKIAGGAEPASYSWTSGTSQTWTGGISRYTGVDATTPLDAAVQTSSFTLTTASVTTGSANALIVAGLWTTAGTTTPPAGMTEAWERAPGNFDVETAYVIQPSAGASGTKTFTQSSGSAAGLFITALRDAAPSATISPTFVASAEQVFSPAVVPTLYVNPTFVPTTAQVFAPQVLGTGQVGPLFLASEEQVFPPASVQVTSGPQAVTPNFIPTGEQVFAPIVIAARQVNPAFIASAEQVFSPSITLAGLAPSRVHAAHEPAVHVVVDHEPL